MSDTATASTLALIVNESNGNLDDFSISTSTCRREGIKATKDDSKKIKEDFVSKLSGRSLTLHFDGKSVREFTGGKHLQQERIAVIVSSPELEQPQVLGVPPAPSSKAEDQENVIVDLIEEWGLKNHIMAFGFDTTSSNTGRHNGAVGKSSKRIY